MIKLEVPPPPKKNGLFLEPPAAMLNVQSFLLAPYIIVTLISLHKLTLIKLRTGPTARE